MDLVRTLQNGDATPLAVNIKGSFAGASSLVLSLLDRRKAKRSLMMSFTAVQ